MKEEKNITKFEYVFEIDERKAKIIKSFESQNGKEINMFFGREDESEVIKDVLKQLSKYYIEDILNTKT